MKASVADRVWVIVAVAVLGITGSIVVSRVVQSRERRLLEFRLDQRAHDRAGAIDLELQAMVTHVRSIASLIIASGPVDRKQFRTFATSILEHEPAFQAVGYDVVVSREERTLHEAKIRSEGYAGYRIVEKTSDGDLVAAADRAEYIPVSLLEPLEGNEAALGYDVGSDPRRRATLDRARDTGSAGITEAVVLVQERGDQLGTLICVPVYSGDPPVNVAERRSRIRGFAVGVIRIGDLVAHALEGLTPAGVHLRVVDETNAEDPRLLHRHVSRTVAPDTAESRDLEFDTVHRGTYQFEIAGRRWAVDAIPTDAFLAAQSSRAPAVLLLGGLLSTVAMCAYIWREASANARLRSAVLARRRAEELRESFGRVLDESLEEVYVFDAESLRFLHVNRGARSNLGYSMDELRSMTPLDLKPLLSHEEFSATLRPLRDRTRHKIEFRTAHRRRDGSRYEVEVHLQMTSFDGGSAFVAVILDISDRLRQEERQRQNQKLEALGTLAGGTAHDVNNLLTAIIGYTELCQQEAPPHGNTRSYLAEVLKASERARDVVRQILTFSRGKPAESLPLDLRDVIREALKLMRVSLPTTITIHEDLADACFVRGDSSQIHQVLMNLCTNAAQAMRDRHGTLSVNMKAVELDAAAAGELGDLSSGRHVRVQVRDDGDGIPPEILERIFDPFFTTKKPGEGTGMGLAVAHGIVKGHGGTIRVTSKVNHGTVFSIYLPRIESLAPEPVDLDKAPAWQGGRILVVDDEATITQMLVQMLSASGYDAEACSDGSSALDVLSGRADDFDLVITDYTMPRMTGTTLAREIGRRFPGIRVILVSGYGDLIDRQEIRSSGVHELLSKPFRLEEIHAVIRRALERAPARAGSPTAWPRG